MKVLAVPTEMEAAAKRVEESIQQYEQATADAKAAADDLASKWAGDAQVAFVQEQEKAIAWLKQMAETSKGYADALKKYAKELRDRDNQGKGIISG